MRHYSGMHMGDLLSADAAVDIVTDTEPKASSVVKLEVATNPLNFVQDFNEFTINLGQELSKLLDKVPSKEHDLPFLIFAGQIAFLKNQEILSACSAIGIEHYSSDGARGPVRGYKARHGLAVETESGILFIEALYLENRFSPSRVGLAPEVLPADSFHTLSRGSLEESTLKGLSPADTFVHNALQRVKSDGEALALVKELLGC